MTNDKQTLEPCPFCGCGLSIEHVDLDWWEVQGDHEIDCPIASQDTHYCDSISIEEIVKQWNTRTPRTFTQEQVWKAAQAMSPDTLIEGDVDSVKFYNQAKAALEAVGRIE